MQPKSLDSLSPTMQATRRRILDGAKLVLSERGIAATTVEDILKSSGVSRRTYYQYFKSKIDLLEAIYEDSAERLLGLISHSLQEVEISEKLASTVDAYLGYQRDGGALVIALQAEAVRPDSRLSARRDRTLDTIVALIDGNVREVLSLKIDPLAYRALLMAIDCMVIDLQRDGTFTTRDSDRVRQIAIIMFAQLLAAGKELPVPDYLSV